VSTTVDLGGRAVIVTGGTRGLGAALGLEFARAGAAVYLTHRWGGADEDALRASFDAEGLPRPCIVESDASDPGDARTLMQEVAKASAPLHAIVSNVAFGGIAGEDIEALSRNSLELSLRYSTWPILDLLRASRETLGLYPRYALAISSDGGQICHPGYDMIGVAKAALETLCRYLAFRLRPDGVRVNAVRSGPIDSDSTRAMFGDAMNEPAARTPGFLTDARTVARACVALCGGLMDGITGQVITVDEGASLFGPLTYLRADWPPPFPRSGEGNGP
jgi:NAD(P)-dependent dehydrogenase (short-subunit alcohol dehydrogenase family)